MYQSFKKSYDIQNIHSKNVIPLKTKFVILIQIKSN